MSGPGKIIAIDLDGTIGDGALMDLDPPAKGVADAIFDLREAGYYIVIFTSRVSPKWWAREAEARDEAVEYFGAIQMAYVANYLYRHHIPYDEITAEKPYARIWFDDRAWRTSPTRLAADLREFLENGRMGLDDSSGSQRGSTAAVESS